LLAGGEADLAARLNSAACGAVIAALAVGFAVAADMPRLDGPYPAPALISAYSWTGPYLGGNFGYELGRTTHNPTRPSGVAGGAQGGYSWQSGQFVVGAEADLTLSGARDTFAPWKFSNPWFGTLRGRAGFALNRVLLYGTVGFAFGGGDADLITGSADRRTHLGWTAGGGMEIGLTPNWSARAEYLFVDLADRPYAVTGVSNGFESSLLRFGINYRF
jgi:outer membrane immunogenic protein